ncbi:lactadherin-like [Acanthaster planci]|uniref:Lactadherin-like n=1 Tax=Acanthaster planci TaxID=133434 RepID=A0A8B7ZQG2_ACAPL|nr:lactadherin-like [Acanthaster planci]
MHGAEKFDAGMQLSVLPYHNPCGCSAVRLGGIVVNHPLIAPHPTEGLFLSENTDEIRQHLDCPRRIGSITGAGKTGAWRPDSDTAGQWIQVDLGREAVVTGVIVQGRSAHDGSEQQQWVTEYAVEYASEGYPTRQTVQDGEGNVATFPGSTDSDSSMTSRFYGAILANVICIKPTSWYSGVALRFELLGCLPS